MKATPRLLARNRRLQVKRRFDDEGDLVVVMIICLLVSIVALAFIVTK